VVIRDLHDCRRQDAARRRARAARSLRERLADGFDFFGRTAVLGGEVDQLTVEPVNPRQIRPAEQRRRSRDCIEGRLHSRRRARDNAQDLGRRRLPLKRLRQVAVSRLQRLEQPHVLYRDHGLVGEGLE
jgi:hypothetical protein